MNLGPSCAIGSGSAFFPVKMVENRTDIGLDVESRQKDVRIGMEGTSHGKISFTITGGSGRKEPFEGPYSVASLANELQLFNTENKVMTENLVVLPIPYYETSNPKGGLTVYIGGE